MSDPHSFPRLPDLQASDQAALEAIAGRRTLGRGEVLYSQGEEAPAVLFPVAGVIRATAGLADGEGVLAGLIGPGGAAGLAPVLAGRPANHAATALSEVVGFAVAASPLRRLATERPALGLALSALLAEQVAQAQDELACCAHHRIEPRLARLLLRLQDPVDTLGVAVTQDELAEMLAVQRTTVTMLAHRLKTVGMIAYSRGKLRIVDRVGMAGLACGCPVSAGMLSAAPG